MTQKLVQAIKLAKESIRGLELDDVEKSAAMAKAIDYFLKDVKDIPMTTAESTIVTLHKDDDAEKVSTTGDFWSILESKSRINTNKLKDIFSIKEKQITLVLPNINGNLIPEKQRNVALLILYAYTNGLGMEWVSSALIVEGLKDFAIYDRNLSRNLDKQSNWFRKKGRKKGLNYKLSGVGIVEAKTYLGSL